MTDLRIEFESTSEFDKELKKFTRKYKSLPEDIKTFKSALYLAHFMEGIASESIGIFPISHKSLPEGFFVAKKFACKSLKGSGSRSGFRVVYQLDKNCYKLCFIEMFHKNNKSVPDFERLKRFLPESPERFSFH